MFFHFIVISNNYVIGHRIGWHFASPHKLDSEYLGNFMREIESKCGDVQFGIHKLITNSETWNSVVEKDSFFKDVLIMTDADEFIKALKKDRKLSVHDVAKFIIGTGTMTHLKLQKLIYYAYAEYLLRFNKKMFPEQIVAYKYGPVVEEIFYDYRHHGSSKIDDIENDVFYSSTGLTGTPSMLKILSSDDGMNVVDCLLDVMIRYGHVSARDLVSKTHATGGPWDKVYIPGMNRELTDEVIKEYHHKVI